MDAQRQALARFNFAQKYARYNPTEQRRETWSEATSRVMSMHRAKLGELAPDLEHELAMIEALINERRILGSQRSLQFGGQAVLDKHARSYNCTSCYVDDVSRFAQALYLLLCGAGVGYSVQDHHVAQLPPILTASELSSKSHAPHLIPDTIEGWADAFDALMRAYTSDASPIPSFDFSAIRPKGAPISSCGGRAPSGYPLRVALTRAENLLLGAGGRQLKPSEASDLMCILADCVLAGGVRRSALLCMFSVDTVDPEMMSYKSRDQWWATHPYRARANISALVLRDDPEGAEKFKRVFEHTRNYGEPAVIWADSTEVAYNPCVEIGMCPTLIRAPAGYYVEEYTRELIDPARRQEWIDQGYTFETAFQFCNLCEINASRWETREDAMSAVMYATILGCIQASYTGTDDDYLSDTATRAILERECLLGVSLTGLANAPAWAREPETLRALSEVAHLVALDYWSRCGLPNPPARVTCVKPSGNAGVNLGCSSGVHPEHARRYIRRIQVPATSPIVRAFAEANPHAVEECVWSSSGDDVTLAFAVEVPEGSLTRDEQSAREFLELVRDVQTNWVVGGTVRPESVEGLTHNVSNTCTVRADEWDEVAEMLVTGRAYYGGVSCLGASGDYDYPQPPLRAVYEEIADDDPHATAKREARAYWERLRAEYRDVDYSSIIELEDNTELMREGACFGGTCEI